MPSGPRRPGTVLPCPSMIPTYETRQARSQRAVAGRRGCRATRDVCDREAILCHVVWHQDAEMVVDHIALLDALYPGIVASHMAKTFSNEFKRQQARCAFEDRIEDAHKEHGAQFEARVSGLLNEGKERNGSGDHPDRDVPDRGHTANGNGSKGDSLDHTRLRHRRIVRQLVGCVHFVDDPERIYLDYHGAKVCGSCMPMHRAHMVASVLPQIFTVKI